MKLILIAILSLFSCLGQCCDLEQAIEVMEKIHPLFSQMKGQNLTKVGFCDRNDYSGPCCIEIGFDSEQNYTNVRNVFKPNLKLYDLDVKFSFGPINHQDALVIRK
jgi:hypothetical protein